MIWDVMEYYKIDLVKTVVLCTFYLFFHTHTIKRILFQGLSSRRAIHRRVLTEVNEE